MAPESHSVLGWTTILHAGSTEGWLPALGLRDPQPRPAASRSQPSINSELGAPGVQAAGHL